MSTAQPFPNDPVVDSELARAHKLTPQELQLAQSRLGRDPTYAELGVLSVMFSEHCSYKSSRVHLKRLPTDGPRVIQGPGENAGVVDVGDGVAVVFKMESHNHPSYIEPYQGAATGVGGILRDVFTMGARPIAALNSLRFGRPDHPRTPELLRGVVAGIGGYGNCIGVPTVGGEVMFDKAYDGNILVNAFTCGVAPADRIFYGRASGVGNPVLYVGARTGRDGIHGATMASDEFSEGGPSQRPTVQVGDPFMEKLLLEACLEIFADEEGLLIGIQDMGAAGLTSSSVEMAGRSGSGLDLNLDKVPRRARGLTPYEMLLSESQERMLLVAKPGREERVIEICKKWELDAVVIGEVTDTGRWVVRATPGFDPLSDQPVPSQPVVVCDLPVDLLTDAAPVYDRPQADDARREKLVSFDPSSLAESRTYTDVLLTLVGHPNYGSRQWVYRQYDAIVRGGTAVRPGAADAAVVRAPCQVGNAEIKKLLAFASDCNGRLCELDPFGGAAMAVAEVCRNLVCVGAEPVGITDCLNFGNPERPEIMRQFALCIDGMAKACNALAVPIVSGNVSLYNETDGRAILPTPTVAAVGLIKDEAHVTTMAWPAGADVLLLGALAGGPLGGSAYLTETTGDVKGPPPQIDLDAEVRLQTLLLDLIRSGKVLAAHDISEGGLAIALAECASASGVGATIELTTDESALSALFGEAPSRVVIASSQAADIEQRAKAAGVPVCRLGRADGQSLTVHINGEIGVDARVADITAARETCLDRIVS